MPPVECYCTTSGIALKTSLKSRFSASAKSGREIGLEPGAIKYRLDKDGAVATVRKYGTGPMDIGMKVAWEKLGPQFTMEGLIVSDKFRGLFTAEEIAAAQAKLEAPT